MNIISLLIYLSILISTVILLLLLLLLMISFHMYLEGS